MLLFGFSLGAYFLEIPRLFLYGGLAAAAPVVGDVLFRRDYAPHHGFPIAFGIVSAIIVAWGLMRFWRVVLSKTPRPDALPGDGKR